MQKYVEYIWVRFLNLVEQYYRVGLTPDGFSKLPTLVVTYISRRRTNQTTHRMGLLIFAHVYSGHHGLVIEQELREGLGKLCLADAGRTEEQERAERSVLVGESCTASSYGI